MQAIPNLSVCLSWTYSGKVYGWPDLLWKRRDGRKHFVEPLEVRPLGFQRIHARFYLAA